MISVGDRVKFISDTGVGIVRSIKNGIAQVDVDGFEIPSLISDIVLSPLDQEQMAKMLIGPSDAPTKKSNLPQNSKGGNKYGKLSIEDDFEDEPIDVLALKRQFAASQKAISKDAEAAPAPVKIAQHKLTDYVVKLIFVPSQSDRLPNESDLDLYIVNDCSYDVAYAIGKYERDGYVSTLGNGICDSDSKIKITTFKRSELNNVIYLDSALMPFKSESYVVKNVSQTKLELHPLKFVRDSSYVENDYFDELSYIFDLTNEPK